MNIIRTGAVELSSIPAVAYKQKLKSGGSGLRILRMDTDAAAVYTIDKRDGRTIPYKPADASLFPDEAVAEALELTENLPYSARRKITVSSAAGSEESVDVAADDAEDADMVGSEFYEAIVDRYSDEKGALNYDLMNKDFMRFASRSKLVGDLLAAKAGEDEILIHIVRDRASFLAGSREVLTDAQAAGLIESLDEINPRSAFKELKGYLRRRLSR